MGCTLCAPGCRSKSAAVGQPAWLAPAALLRHWKLLSGSAELKMAAGPSIGRSVPCTEAERAVPSAKSASNPAAAPGPATGAPSVRCSLVCRSRASNAFGSGALHVGAHVRSNSASCCITSAGRAPARGDIAPRAATRRPSLRLDLGSFSKIAETSRGTGCSSSARARCCSRRVLRRAR